MHPTKRTEINAMFNHVTGGNTDWRVDALIAASKRFNLPVSAFDIEECADEKTGRRYGSAACRRGWSAKLGGGGRNRGSRYAYQVWAVVKPEFRK